uniref:Uncharacterized protein n=1 Tax=Rhizophora mucronata TaxID=61149 RepID=A0A2P2IXP8_RHIMU
MRTKASKNDRMLSQNIIQKVQSSSLLPKQCPLNQKLIVLTNCLQEPKGNFPDLQKLIIQSLYPIQSIEEGIIEQSFFFSICITL